MVHRAAHPFRVLGHFEFGDDFVDRAGVAVDRKRDVLFAERAVTLSVACEIKWYDRDPFAAHVVPDIEFGPVKDRVNADMGACDDVGIILVPELRWLIAHVPISTLRTGAENPLLGTDRLLVAPDSQQDPLELMRFERASQTKGLPGRRA